MQPYFLPYIGYWQLMHAVDAFVLYDNIQYTRKGWINRNRFLLNGAAAVFTVPLQGDSDFLDIGCRRISADFQRDKLLRRVEAAYRRAPQFSSAFPVIEAIVCAPQENLFEYLLQSVSRMAEYLGIDTPLILSSSVAMNHSLRGEQRVIALCEALRATGYVNPIGGTDLYSRSTFREHGIELAFLRTRILKYPQLGGEFVPSLSILDVVMFNDHVATDELLELYDLA